MGRTIALVALAALVDTLARARRLRQQRALSDLAALTWQQFEEVIADAFRRHGYRVREVGGRGRADGGVDLVLVRRGETTVVQVKHWRSDRFGVQLIRELYGVQRAIQAERSMFVATGGTPPTPVGSPTASAWPSSMATSCSTSSVPALQGMHWSCLCRT